MSRHRVEICGVNTANIKVLKNEEMITLFKELQNGNKEAKEQLINGNLKLVLSILRKYTNRTDNMDDLFQVGCIGLIKAIDNFDLKHEVRFSTYAVPMILGEVKRYLRDNSSVRVSRSLKDLAYKALKIKEILTNKLNKEPTIEQISKELETSEFEVYNALESMKDVYSMSEPLYNENGDSVYLADQISDKKTNHYYEDLILKEAIEGISKKEQFIIIQRYFEGKTQMELSQELKISQAQISRIEKTALDNMKKIIK